MHNTKGVQTDETFRICRLERWPPRRQGFGLDREPRTGEPSLQLLRRLRREAGHQSQELLGAAHAATRHPTAGSVAQQIVECCAWDRVPPRFLIHDRDSRYGASFDRRLRGLGYGKFARRSGRLEPILTQAIQVESGPSQARRSDAPRRARHVRHQHSGSVVRGRSRQRARRPEHAKIRFAISILRLETKRLTWPIS
jgi:hypothetical protein